jgi:hypothetical protein
MRENIYDKIFNTLDNSSKSADIEYATVHSVVSGRPVLIFSGEAAPSAKEYKCMKSYMPEAGDRVMLIGGIIAGGWRN